MKPFHTFSGPLAGCAALILLWLAAPCAAAILGDPQIVASQPGSQGNDVGPWASFAQDAWGGQHVAYYDATEKNLKYAHRPHAASSWILEVVDEEGDVGRYCSLALRQTPFVVQYVGLSTTAGTTTLTVDSGTTLTQHLIGGHAQIISATPDATVYEVIDVNLERHEFTLSPPLANSLTTASLSLNFYQPAISYQQVQGSGAALKVAYPDMGQWVIETVEPASGLDEDVQTGFYTSIGYAPSALRIAYQERTFAGSNPAGTLRQAFRYMDLGSTNWLLYTMDATPGAGRNARMVLKSDSSALIFHQNEVSQELMVCKVSGSGTGQSVVLDDANPTGDAIDARYFEPADAAVISYRDVPASGDVAATIRFAAGDGLTTWTQRPVLTGTVGVGDYTAIAPGATTDTETVAYYDQNHRRLLMRQRSAGAYGNNILLDSGEDVGRYCSAQVNPEDGEFYVAYYDASLGALKMAHYDGATTDTHYIDGVKIGTWSQTGLTSDSVVVAYHHDTEGSLRVATWPRGTGPSDALATDVLVDHTSSDVGESVAMAIDQYGRIFLIYYDRGQANVGLAIFSNGAWQTRRLTPGVSAGQGQGNFCDLALSADNNSLGILYYDALQQRPVYGTADLPGVTTTSLTLSFTTSVLESTELGTGRFCALAAGGSSDWHAAFYDPSAGQPVYARLDSASPTIETIDDTFLLAAGQDIDLTVDPATNQPVAAYYDITNMALKVAQRTSEGTWEQQTLDTDGDTGRDPALLIDETNRQIYVLYYDLSMGEMRIAYRTFGTQSWNGPLTLSDQTRGWRPSGVVDGNGLLTIACHHRSQGDLLTFSATSTVRINSVPQGCWEIYR